MEERPDGSFRVYLANGKFLTVRRVDDLGKLSREAAERSVGKLTDKEWANFRVHGAFAITWSDGRRTSSYGLIRLVNGEADSKTLRHEMLHAARSLGLITEAEWRALVEKYAPESKSDGHAEERIASAFEAWQGPEGLWRRLTTAINRVLSSLGVVAPSADTAFARLREGKVWSREARPETNAEVRRRMAGDVRTGDFNRVSDDGLQSKRNENTDTDDTTLPDDGIRYSGRIGKMGRNDKTRGGGIRPATSRSSKARAGDAIVRRWNRSASPTERFMRPRLSADFYDRGGRRRTMTPRQYERYKRLTEKHARRLIAAHDFQEHGVATSGTNGRRPTVEDMARLTELYRIAGAKAKHQATKTRGKSLVRDPGPISKLVRAVRVRSLREQVRKFENVRPRENESRSHFKRRREAAERRSKDAIKELRRMNVGLGIVGRLRSSTKIRPARFGSSTSGDYQETFFDAHPELRGTVWVHHAVERQVLEKYPGVVTESEMHSLENLRGIPNESNSDLHLKRIRIEWNRFYSQFDESGIAPTKRQLLDKATEIDGLLGSEFTPRIGG